MNGLDHQSIARLLHRLGLSLSLICRPIHPHLLLNGLPAGSRRVCINLSFGRGLRGFLSRDPVG